MDLSLTDYVRVVVDPVRLGVLGTLAGAQLTAKEVAARLGLREREVLRVIGDLRAAGLVVAEADGYRLDRLALRRVAAQLPREEPPAASVFEGMSGEEAEVLGRFFRGTRLIEIPAQESKRRVVLERIALDFEPGVRYSEREVNLRLAMYHADYASLRRYLVDTELLARADGAYWRIGGRV